MTCRREQVEEGEVGVDVDVIGHCFGCPSSLLLQSSFSSRARYPYGNIESRSAGGLLDGLWNVSVLPPDHYVGAWLVCLASPHLSLCELQSRILRQSVHTVFLVVLFTACLSGSTRDMRVPC